MQNSDYYFQIFHEIKNSITLINSYLQLIEKKHPEVMDYDYWSASCSEITRLRTIVTEFSQLKPDYELQLECVDFRKFITEFCQEFQCYADETHISFQLHMPKEPLPVLIDRRQLHFVFVNLFKNACEAMPPHGQLQIKAFRHLEHVTIYLKDTGCGISPSLIEHIFNPFVTTKEDGSGLGLNIAQQIVHAHNGTIAVTSPEGEGTTFTITLPCQASNINI